MHNIFRTKEKGFTLIELLLAMAVISILSGAILVSISSQRQRAHQSKMLAELSGAVQPILMCRTDGETVVRPHANGGEAICSGLSEYGTWPSASTGFTYTASTNAEFNSGSWYFVASDASRKICCNSASGKCHDQAVADTCTAINPAN